MTMPRPSLDDLDRCPHGRHAGDTCAGWKGPGVHDGGCYGGISLGNAYLIEGQQIGTTIHGQPILAPQRCDAYDCTVTGTQEFTVGKRPPGVQGLDGWPAGAPELDDCDLHDKGVPEGTVIRFCGRHARQLREAAQPWLALPANGYTAQGVVAPPQGQRVAPPPYLLRPEVLGEP